MSAGRSASGAVKMQDSAEVARRKLDCYVYYLLGADNEIKTHAESIHN